MLPAIVAHRGDAEHFPENTLPALEAAWRRGIAHVEFDVQVSADGVPFVIHDASLERTTRCAGDVRLTMSGQLDGVDAGEPARFGCTHAGTALPRLSAVAGLMAGLPDAHAFVEVKRASLVHHGRAHCIERVLAAIAPVLDRCVVISFDADAVRLARTAGRVRIGWVLDGDPAQLRSLLDLMNPEFVFCDHRRLPAGRAPPAGDWTWVAYEVTDATLALDLAGRGVAMVESMAPLRLSAELTARGALSA
ncbi:MAG TPA: glycerophosphodiester phosphodiesterase family protein [Steroidobacteraceae bacterium]|jgi:glycerophosphoryl diester phosphodiesterase|nr:glycerophosphodiester phosphodiesterase family protein [Steroidobacteraceae bacterium]